MFACNFTWRKEVLCNTKRPMRVSFVSNSNTVLFFIITVSRLPCSFNKPECCCL